jgi:4-hydroxy-4-methyl-2-oxoglutarate aldolase
VTEALTPAELAALRAISTPTISNAIETFRIRPRNKGFMDSSVVCRFPELGSMAGYAATIKIRASEKSQDSMPAPAVWAAFEEVPRPWVVVVQDLDYPNPTGSYWGEVNGSVYQALGAVGTVTNGGVRDLPEVRPTGFHFFSSCILVSHAYVHVVEAGAPVEVGGLTVRPADFLHGDEHGVISIPLEIARDLPDAARKLESAERRLIEHARSGSATVQSLADIYGRVD